MSRVNKGKTDLWTTLPDVASMLVDKEVSKTPIDTSILDS